MYNTFFIWAMNKTSYANLPDDLKAVIDANSELKYLHGPDVLWISNTEAWRLFLKAIIRSSRCRKPTAEIKAIAASN